MSFNHFKQNSTPTLNKTLYDSYKLFQTENTKTFNEIFDNEISNLTKNSFKEKSFVSTNFFPYIETESTNYYPTKKNKSNLKDTTFRCLKPINISTSNINNKSLLLKLKKITKKLLNDKKINQKKINQKTFYSRQNNFSQKISEKSYKLNTPEKTHFEKTKSNELRFKVFNLIKSNYMPPCNKFFTKVDSFNNKILEYYKTNNYTKMYKSYNKHFHYKLNPEIEQKIDMYLDLKKINDTSNLTKKINFKESFTKEEQKLILLHPDYYFRNTNINCFKNKKLIFKKTLTQQLQEEENELKQKRKKKYEKIKKFLKTEKKMSKLCESAKIEWKPAKKLNNFSDNKKKERSYLDVYNDNIKLLKNLIRKEEKKIKSSSVNSQLEKDVQNSYKKYNNYLMDKNLKNSENDDNSLIDNFKQNLFHPKNNNRKIIVETRDVLIEKNSNNLFRTEVKSKKINNEKNEIIDIMELFRNNNKNNMKNRLNSRKMSKTTETKVIRLFVDKIKEGYMCK